MFRVWAKVFKENRLLRDTVVIDASAATRTSTVFPALEEACRELDLSVPIWLDKNIAEFKRIAKTRFTKDSFIEAVDFDFLEFHVIEEDI